QKHDAKKNPGPAVGDDSGEAGLSQQQVSAIGEKAKKKVANCYLLNADDPVEDTIKVQVLVNASGQIERATVLGKHGANKPMAQCIADEVRKLVFPTGSGASKKYTLPFRVGG
ncbi:MAG: AgmX/PglI C-terminal domain-containing protein, partial [Deltaproteobacteria bacterium]|nr:AgmX/PglI C-terminal domain-containing protein [Deltaproteobacteria bacterium]